MSVAALLESSRRTIPTQPRQLADRRGKTACSDRRAFGKRAVAGLVRSRARYSPPDRQSARKDDGTLRRGFVRLRTWARRRRDDSCLASVVADGVVNVE
jgi:hypothetical protein